VSAADTASLTFVAVAGSPHLLRRGRQRLHRELVQRLGPGVHGDVVQLDIEPIGVAKIDLDLSLVIEPIHHFRGVHREDRLGCGWSRLDGSRQHLSEVGADGDAKVVLERLDEALLHLRRSMSSPWASSFSNCALTSVWSSEELGGFHWVS
jgi:hypothetical protein